jgi:transient receptor potential cation channel subfamily A protein 1
MCISFRRYIFSIENIGEISLLLLTFVLIFLPTANTNDDIALRHIAGIVILLSWTEFVLLIGRHPRLSTYIAMFSRVSRNFLSFLTWYAFFIIAFGLCFFIIFHQPPPSPSDDAAVTTTTEEEPTNAHFVDPATSLMKTIVMSLAGELEFESIEFSSTHVGRIIFVLYIFFIMLVLVNLLNGLAVSDISVIQREAEIVSCVSRVELISYIESVLLGDPFQFLTNFPASRLAQRLPTCNLFAAIYRTSCMQRFLSGRRSFRESKINTLLLSMLINIVALSS